MSLLAMGHADSCLSIDLGAIVANWRYIDSYHQPPPQRRPWSRQMAMDWAQIMWQGRWHKQVAPNFSWQILARPLPSPTS